MRRLRSDKTRTGTRLPRLGLRARLTVTYTLGAALLSAFLSITTFGLTRENLLEQREQSATNQAIRNADTLDKNLMTDDPKDTAGIERLLGSLPTSESADQLVHYGDAWIPTSATKFSREDVPAALQEQVGFDQQSRMRVSFGDQTKLIIGVPLLESNGQYYEAASMIELQRTLEGLAISLLGASALTTIAGGLLGFWAARRVFRPFLDVGHAAEAIAGGRLDTRLPIGNDPDIDRLSKPFNEMAQALQDRIERDARFASEVSHELRSPLMTLAASVEVLENSRDEIPARGQTALDLLSADVDRFQQLVEDLLEISRFDAGAIKLHLEEVPVAEMVIQAVSVLGGGGIPVRYDEDVSEILVRVDKRRFGRVLANLLDNAEKYADGATAVTIERVDVQPVAEEEPAGPIEHLVRIAVEDLGPGVPEDERESIFDRFSRGGEGGRRATDSGVGLGLALVDEHARLHGGRVWVEGRTDDERGSRFVVELPAMFASPAPTHEEEKVVATK